MLPDQVSVVSTVIATLFLRTTLHSSSVSDGQTYLGLIFFAIIHMVIPITIRPCDVLRLYLARPTVSVCIQRAHCTHAASADFSTVCCLW